MLTNVRSMGKESSNQQEVLFRTALEMFSEKGFDGVSMRDIARHAGCSVSLIYNYYPSKSDLLHAIVGEAQAQVGATLAELEQPGSATDRLAAYLNAVMELVERHHTLWRVVHLLRMQRHLFPEADVREFQERTLGRLDELLHKGGPGRSSGRAAFFFAAIDGLVAQYLLHENFPLREGARACLDTFISELRRQK